MIDHKGLRRFSQGVQCESDTAALLTQCGGGLDLRKNKRVLWLARSKLRDERCECESEEPPPASSEEEEKRVCCLAVSTTTTGPQVEFVSTTEHEATRLYSYDLPSAHLPQSIIFILISSSGWPLTSVQLSIKLLLQNKLCRRGRSRKAHIITTPRVRNVSS